MWPHRGRIVFSHVWGLSGEYAEDAPTRAHEITVFNVQRCLSPFGSIVIGRIAEDGDLGQRAAFGIQD